MKGNITKEPTDIRRIIKDSEQLYVNNTDN